MVIDADLQDPPEVIPELVAVLAPARGRRRLCAAPVRAGEAASKRATARLFYLLMQHVGRIHIPRDTGDFRLLSRRAVEALRDYPEHHRFMKGLFTWIGFDQVAIPYERDPAQRRLEQAGLGEADQPRDRGHHLVHRRTVAVCQRARTDHRLGAHS